MVVTDRGIGVTVLIDPPKDLYVDRVRAPRVERRLDAVDPVPDRDHLLPGQPVLDVAEGRPGLTGIRGLQNMRAGGPQKTHDAHVGALPARIRTIDCD